MLFPEHVTITLQWNAKQFAVLVNLVKLLTGNDAANLAEVTKELHDSSDALTDAVTANTPST